MTTGTAITGGGDGGGDTGAGTGCSIGPSTSGGDGDGDTSTGGGDGDGDGTCASGGTTADALVPGVVIGGGDGDDDDDNSIKDVGTGETGGDVFVDTVFVPVLWLLKIRSDGGTVFLLIRTPPDIIE